MTDDPSLLALQIIRGQVQDLPQGIQRILRLGLEAHCERLVASPYYGAACHLAFWAEINRHRLGELSPAADFSRVAYKFIEHVTDANRSAREAAWWLLTHLEADLPAPGSVGPLVNLVHFLNDPSSVPEALHDEYSRSCYELKQPQIMVIVEFKILHRKWDEYSSFRHIAPLVCLAAWQAFVEGTILARNLLTDAPSFNLELAYFVLGRRTGDSRVDDLLYKVALRHGEQSVWPKASPSERELLVHTYANEFYRMLNQYLPLEAMQKPNSALYYAKVVARRATGKVARSRSLKNWANVELLSEEDLVKIQVDQDLVYKEPKQKLNIPLRIDDALWSRIERLLPREAAKPRVGAREPRIV